VTRKWSSAALWSDPAVEPERSSIAVRPSVASPALRLDIEWGKVSHDTPYSPQVRGVYVSSNFCLTIEAGNVVGMDPLNGRHWAELIGLSFVLSERNKRGKKRGGAGEILAHVEAGRCPQGSPLEQLSRKSR
jgi:hypothetical protein